MSMDKDAEIIAAMTLFGGKCFMGAYTQNKKGVVKMTVGVEGVEGVVGKAQR